MKKQSAFTLLELMISLVLGLIVIGATISIYIGAVKGSVETVRSARLNHDLDMAMSLMINDIRRSSFWGGAIADSDAENNPFTQAASRVQIRNFASPTTAVNSGDCVLYTYDADGDGTFDPNNNGVDSNDGDDIDDRNEFYGFRLESQSIRMRLTGTTAADCSDGSWGTGELIDSDVISITALSFDQSLSKYVDVSTTTTYETQALYEAAVTGGTVSFGDSMALTRQIDISITGALVADSTVTKTLTGTVKVRNNRIFAQP